MLDENMFRKTYSRATISFVQYQCEIVEWMQIYKCFQYEKRCVACYYNSKYNCKQI